jgi:hypothetical protein
MSENMKFYILLFCLLSVKIILTGNTQNVEVSAEEYAVYSAYLNGTEKNPNDGKAVKLIVINDHAIIIKDTCSQDKIAEYDKRIANDDLRVLFESLRAKNRESISLKRRFNIRHDYVLLHESDLAAILKAKDIEGWDYFYEKYPNSSGYVSLSRVGFNTTFTKAIVFIEQSCGSLCSSGDYILFEKRDGKWREVDKFNCWIS